MAANTVARLIAISTFVHISLCMTSAGRSGHGLIGYGINMYFPNCCTSCRDVLSASRLHCSDFMDVDGMAGMDMTSSDFTTSAECYATDDAFLQSMAVCISQRCPTDPSRGDLKDWQIEQWWQSYEESLAKVKDIPTETIVSGDPLNHAMLVSDDDYQSNWNANNAFENGEDLHERYALVVFLSGVVIPMGFSLFRFIPFPAHWVSAFNAYMIDPPAIGLRHKVPILWGLTTMPTRGQTLFILYLTIINVILCSVGYSSKQPNAWWPDDAGREILTYVTNRMGVLSFANVPLLILYAGRNNVLLWLTNWNYETFVLLHRYVAAIATLQAVVHSLIYLHHIYVVDGTHSSESKLPYWYWGAIATIGMSILLPTSVLPLRRMLYEVFLLWHIAISILVVVGCYLHIYDRFEHQWGYEVWIYVAIAVWVFDRLLRVARLARNGLRWAGITVIDDDYIRVDIEGVGGNGHAYLYFPTLTWRVWENHPFSVASTVLNIPKRSVYKKQLQPLTADVEKTDAILSTTAAGSSHSTNEDSGDHHVQPPKLAMTFLLRGRGGLTSLLRSSSRIPVFVESSYGQHQDFSEHQTLICVAGGVGITTVLPLLRVHRGRSKLLWGVRTKGLVDAMAGELADVDQEMFIGKCMDVREELEKAIGFAGMGQNFVVVVSGPERMADDVRNAVCAIAKLGKKVSVRLIEESFSW
ncbi:hypothetical protein PV11_05750 [Exophiala sideris]|uniref:Ferric oxidoreductase domain-containing protein n=1 Tax=Exophiala sideris TaxID=1016849 RepID=A0A0D1W4Z1_9EURO|nr:hypothetical protein PV11_05750 [Exophiala sideris]